MGLKLRKLPGGRSSLAAVHAAAGTSGQPVECKLPNSLIFRSFIFGLSWWLVPRCPGTEIKGQKLSTEIAIALNLDSCYIVIRNRVKEDLDSDVVDLSVERICKPITLFLFWGTFRKMTSLRITIHKTSKRIWVLKREYLVISHSIERHGSHICKSSR